MSAKQKFDCSIEVEGATTLKGKFNLPVSTSDPIANGDLLIYENGSTHRLMWKAGGEIYYVDGSNIIP